MDLACGSLLARSTFFYHQAAVGPTGPALRAEQAVRDAFAQAGVAATGIAVFTPCSPAKACRSPRSCAEAHATTGVALSWFDVAASTCPGGGMSG